MTFEFIGHLLILHLVTVGVHIVTRKEMIFGFVERFWIRHGNPYISSPLTECLYCMPSVWGTGYFFFITLSAGSALQWVGLLPFFCLAAVGIQEYMNLLRP
jgi:hypothetical protein